MKGISNKIITSIYFSIEDYHDAVKVVFEFGDDCLCFDHQFLAGKTDQLKAPGLKWEKVNYDGLKEQLSIAKIREDEGTSSFVRFSNDDIFFIYQSIDGKGLWLNQFEIVNNANT